MTTKSRPLMKAPHQQSVDLGRVGAEISSSETLAITRLVLMALISAAAAFSMTVAACSRPGGSGAKAASDSGIKKGLILADALFQEKTINRFGLRNSGRVALTFDDGPHPKHTPMLLDLLKREGVKASFFVLGERARSQASLLARMRAEGHVIGNHSDTHANLSLEQYVAEPERVVQEIAETNQVISPFIFTAGGSGPQRHPYFRAPYGAWRSSHAEILNSFAELSPYVGPIGWTAGSALTFTPEGRVATAADWACWQSKNNISIEDCAAGYMSEIEASGGGVVLMHDITPNTVRLAGDVIRRLKERGYQMVTLDEIVQLDQYE